MRLILCYLTLCGIAFSQTAFRGLYPGTIKQWYDHTITTPTMSDTYTRFAACGIWTSYGAGSKSIRKVRFATEWIVSSGGSNVDIALQDIDSSLTFPIRPDGTDDQTATVTTYDNTSHRPFFTSPDLSSDRSMQEGEPLCAIIRWGSTGRLGSDYIQFRLASNRSNFGGGNLSSLRYSTSWVVSGDTHLPAVEFVNSDGTISGLVGAVGAFSQTPHVFNSSSSPNKYGIRFTPNVGFRSSHVYIHGRLNQDYSVVLCDASGTALKTVSVDGSALGGFGGDTPAYHGIQFDYTFTSGTQYNLEIVPGSSSISLFSNSFASSESKKTIGADEVSLISRTGSGSYTVTDTAYIPIQFDIISITASGTSSSQSPIQ